LIIVVGKKRKRVASRELSKEKERGFVEKLQFIETRGVQAKNVIDDLWKLVGGAHYD